MISLRCLAILAAIVSFPGVRPVHAADGPSAEEVVVFLGFGLETGRPDWFPSRTPGEMVMTSETPFILELRANPEDEPSSAGTKETLVAKSEKLGDCVYKLTFDAHLENRTVNLVLKPDFSKASAVIKRVTDDGLPRVAIPGLASACQSSTGDCGLLASSELGLNKADQDRLSKALAYFQAHFCAGATVQKRKLPF